MKPATLLAIGCLVTACWIGSVSQAEACTCSGGETLDSRDRSVAVFEGTVVDQRLVVHADGLYWFPAPQQFIAVRRVWKGVSTDRVSALYLNAGMCSGPAPVGMPVLFFLIDEHGSLAYMLCSPNRPIAGAEEALAKLGPPIATFDDRSATLNIPATMPLSRRLRAFVVVAVAYYRNAQVFPFPHVYPPLKWSHGLLLGVLLFQLVSAILLLMRRLRRRSVLLFATSAMTLAALLLWTGHDLMSGPNMSHLTFWS
jgi:hypothetical protein